MKGREKLVLSLGGGSEGSVSNTLNLEDRKQ